MSANFRLRPSRRAIALEPRLLFDGAGAVAGADALVDDWNEVDDPVEAPADAAPSDDTQTVLVIIDARVADHDLLSADLPANITVRIIGEEESGLAITGEALANGHNGLLFDAVHIVSHGKPGSLTLGNDVINNENLTEYSAELQTWALHLSIDADILLYGCDIAAGDDGEAFITELARLTEADIAASTDATGAADQGGNWTLESQTGPIEAGIIFSEAVTEGYAGLLDSSETPTPTVDLELDDQHLLIGKDFTFELNFNNLGGVTGYGPYIDLYLPKGFDGNDGISIADNGAITYLDQPVNYTIYKAGDLHPYAKGEDGEPLEITGDDDTGQVIVIELPFGSYTTDQPVANLMVTATLSELADVGEGKNLTIKANSGFRYGKTPVEDYATDPSIVGDEITLEITPSVVEYEFAYNGPENETASGPNFPRSVTTTIEVAPGQTLSNYTFTVDVPNNVVVTGYTVDSGSLVELEESIQGGQLDLSLGNISGERSVTLHYFVPELDSNADPILDPTQGGTVKAEFHVRGSGEWTPQDTRDDPQTISFAPETVEIEHEIKPLTVQKHVEITNDTGKPGATPGDTLTYTIDFQVSDFFSFKDIVITDTLHDGHGGIDNITLTITHQGQEITLNVSPEVWSNITAPGTNGETTITFDVSEALKKAGLDGILAQGILEGGRYDSEGHDGATIGKITYTTTITDQYTVKSDKGSIHQNDHLVSDIKIEGTILPVGTSESGERISDGSGTAVDMVEGSLELKVAKVNGEDPVAGGIKPGDAVTYELTYDLATGDYKDLVLDIYLPKPVFSLDSFSSGQYELVTMQGDQEISLGDVRVKEIRTDSDNNKISFVFEDRDDTENEPISIKIRFTAEVTDEPFADNLFLTAQGQAKDNNTENHTATNLDIDQIRLNQPVLTVKHGIVSNTEQGEIDGTSGEWEQPGSDDAPFDGSVTDITGIDGDLTGFDAGDHVVFALGIQNNGGSAAYDVQTTTITAPEGFSFADENGAETNNLEDANLKVYRGDGTELEKGTDYTINENGTITFINSGNGAIGAARDSGGNPVNDGSNIIIITYDAVAKDDIIAGDETTSTAGVESYKSVPGGTDFLPGVQRITDSAQATVAEPEVKIVFKDGSISNDDTTADHTTGADVVIGEAVYYDIVVTLPEGETHDLQVNLDVPDGMKLDTSFNDDEFTGGYKIISEAGTDSNQSGALDVNFDGILGTHEVTENNGNPGQNPLFKFSEITTNSGENNDNSFVIRVRLIAANVEGNRDDTELTPDVFVTYDKGGDNTNTKIESTKNDTTVTVREPELTIEKVVDTDLDTGGIQDDAIDAGDEVTYTITIGNSSGVDAFDLAFQDDFAGMLDGLGSIWTAVKSGTGITDTDDVTDLFEWAGDDNRTLQIKSDANLDLAHGQQIIITVTATTNDSAAAVSSFDSDAIVTWSSIDSANNSADKRDDNERDGNIQDPENTLNNYIATDNAKVEIVSSNTLSRVGGLADTRTDSDTAEGPAEQAIGEIVRFRMVIQVPEGEIPDMSVLLNLPDGYEYLGEARIALIADSDDGLTAGNLDGLQFIGGDEELEGLVGNIEADLTTDNQDNRESENYPGYIIEAVIADGKPVFNLGTVTNHDRDSDKEFIVIEFNAIVANTVENEAGKRLETSFVVKSGDTELSTSNTTVDTLVEPRLSDVDKKVIGMEGDDTTRTLTVSNSFDVGNDVHNSHAYDVILTDSFPDGDSYEFASLKVGETTYTSIDEAQTNGIEIVIDNTNGITVTFDKLDPGSEVELQYKVEVPADKAQSPDDAKATLTWSSLPGESEEFEFIGSTPTEAGDSKGERDHSGIDTDDDPNNYQTTGQAGYGVISGTLWDDTRNQDGTPGEDEVRLAGATVTITWAGPDGEFGGDDDVIFTTTTDENGKYSFGGLPTGKYRIEGPGTFEQQYGDYDTDELTPRSDPDGDANTLGAFIVELGDGITVIEQNIGYLQENDEPSFENVDGTAIGYTEGVNTPEDQEVLGDPVHLAPEGKIYDPEIIDHKLDDFAGTTLTVGRTSSDGGFAPHSDDVLGLDFGEGSGLTLDGSEIKNDNTTVASVNTSVDGQLTITFTADATPDTVNEVLQAITYANRSDTPDESVNIRFRFNDNNQNDTQGSGGALDGDAVVTVNITAKNDPPVAIDDTNSLDRDHEEPIKGNVITGKHTNDEGNPENSTPDSDPETPEDLRITRISVTTDTDDPGSEPRDYEFDGPGSDDSITVIGEYGTLTIYPNGEYDYKLDTGNPKVYGLDTGELEETFLYTLSDGDDVDEGTDTATLTITIRGKDIDGPGIEAQDDNGDATGQATVWEKDLPDAENPTNEAIADGTITVTADAGIKTVTIGDQEFTVDQLRGFSEDYPSTEIRTDKGTLVITGITDEQGDSTAPTKLNIHYSYTLTEAQDQPGEEESTDSFALGVTDNRVSGEDNTSDGTLTIRIVDDTPTAADDYNTIHRGVEHPDGYINQATGNVYSNDMIGADGPDVSGPITHVVSDATNNAGGPDDTVSGAYGTVKIDADGNYTYILDVDNEQVKNLPGNETLTDTFTYTITDADGDPATATLTITIHGNTPPVAADDTRTTDEDTPVSGNVITGEGDGDVQDGDADSDDVLTLTHFTVDTDGDGSPENFNVEPGIPTVVNIDGKGTLEIHSDGSYTFTPVPDWNGQVPDITYTIHDGVDRDAEAVLRITVEPVQDAFPDTDTTIAGNPITTNVLENDKFSGDNPTVTVEPGDHPVNGTVTVNEEGTITYTPDPLFVGKDTYTYTVSSGGVTETSTVTITVTNVPPAPQPDFKSVPEDTPATGNVLINDGTPSNGDMLDDDNHPFELTEFEIDGHTYQPGETADIPGVGTITIDKDGNYTFTPIPDWNGDVPTITYTVSDGYPGGDATSTLNITVTPVPDAFDDKISTESGMPVTFDPTGNDTFSNPDKKITEVTHGNNGTVTITPDGRITYTPNPGFEGTDTFTYTVTSGGITETATVTVNVRGQHIDVPPPAFGDYTPPSMAPEVTGSPLTRSVVRDTSVFFQDEAFDRVDRMQLPFHPIAYVNRQVQVAQDERMATDVRFFSNPSIAQPGEVQSRSIGAGLGADPNLFVQHAVRDTQTRADFLARVIDGRLGRIGLSSDGILPTPDLFQADPGRLVPGATPAPATEPARQDDTLPQEDAAPLDGAPGNADAAPDTNNAGAGQGDTAAALSRLDESADQPDMAADQVQTSLIGRGAPSFTEQLKGGSARLPATLFTPHRDV